MNSLHTSRHGLSPSGLKWVILLALVVCVKELLEPLGKLKVVLKFSFNKLVYRNKLMVK